MLVVNCYSDKNDDDCPARFQLFKDQFIHSIVETNVHGRTEQDELSSTNKHFTN